MRTLDGWASGIPRYSGEPKGETPMCRDCRWWLRESEGLGECTEEGNPNEGDLTAWNDKPCLFEFGWQWRR